MLSLKTQRNKSEVVIHPY